MKSKFLLLLLLSVYGSILAQNKEEVRELFWGSKDKHKSAIEIPDKWKKESAVVIFKNENYQYHKFGTKVTYTSSARKRIKLLDQAAVTEFSEFSFKDRFYSTKGWGGFKKGTGMVGIKIVKPDGTEKEINVDEEAVTTDDVKKIAISNLEIGDIIDYYYYSVEPFVSVGAYGFDPVEETLGDFYPVMDLKITFKTENDFFVNFNTYNGAPELKKISPEGDSDREYELTASDIEKNDFPRWFYPLIELPCYKFQVYFARSGKFEDQASAFLPEKENIIKKTVTKEDILKYYDDNRPFGDLGGVEKFIKGKTFKNDADKVEQVYYFLRHSYYTRFIEAYVANDAKILDPFALYGYAYIIDHDREFTNLFTAFCKDNKITYNIIIGTPRFNGPVSDMLLNANAKMILRTNTEPPVYLEAFSPFTNAGKLEYSLEDTDAYILTMSKNRKIDGVDTVKIPGSVYQDNNTSEVVKVSLNGDFSSLNVAREYSLIGHNKEHAQKNKLYFFDYVYEDYAKYDSRSLMDLVGKTKKKEQYEKEYEALKNKLKDRQKEELEKETESDFGFEIDDFSYEILNTGRFGNKEPLTAKENFAVKNKLIKKAGENYILEIGKLIGEQVQMEEKDRKRTNNIYSIYPRSYDEEVILVIPEGYSVTGLDKLNKKVENKTGGFISTASVEGNKLIIKAHKYYVNYFEPKENWNDMLAFIDAAHQFTQEKILLKKS